MAPAPAIAFNLRTMTADPSNRPTLLGVHSGALGDVVLFGHLLKSIGGRITLAAGGEKARLLAALGVAGRAIDLDALPMHEAFTDTPLDQCRLPRLLGEHDRLISCFGGGNRTAEVRLAAMCAASSAAFLPIRPPAESRLHLLEVWADLLGVELPAGPPAPWPVPPSLAARAARELEKAAALPSPSARYGIIHPGSGSPAKCWPAERFVELARRLAGQGLTPVLVLGPVELETWRQDTAVSRSGLPVLTAPPLGVLAGVLAGATLYVGNDSGVSHLAAAVGAKTLALFGPTVVDHFRPVGRAVATVAAETMEKIDVAAVAGACDALLDS
jgi:hypothetical protein